MYSLKDIYRQAKEDRLCFNPSDYERQGFVKNGVMLNKFGDIIEILNTTRGDYYKEITSDQYEYFHTHGWSKGSLMVAIDNCSSKLKLIDKKIQTEMNSRKNDKYIRGLKSARQRILLSYSKRKRQLKNLN